MTDYRKLHDAQSIAWEWGQGVTDAETAIRKLHKLFPIDGAPASGVRAGMLRAAEICKEWEGKLSQGAGYAIRTAREAITRAADQVSQPDTVAVPIDALVALRSRDVMTRVMIDKHGVSISGWHVPQPAFSQFVPPAIFNILEPYDDHGGSVKAALTRAIQRAAQEAK